MKKILKKVKVNENDYIILYKNVIDENTVEYSLYFNNYELFENPAIIVFYDWYAKNIFDDDYIYLNENEVDKVFIESLKYFEKDNSFDEDRLLESNDFIVKKLFSPINRIKKKYKKK